MPEATVSALRDALGRTRVVAIEGCLGETRSPVLGHLARAVSEEARVHRVLGRAEEAELPLFALADLLGPATLAAWEELRRLATDGDRPLLFLIDTFLCVDAESRALLQWALTLPGTALVATCHRVRHSAELSELVRRHRGIVLDAPGTPSDELAGLMEHELGRAPSDWEVRTALRFSGSNPDRVRMFARFCVENLGVRDHADWEQTLSRPDETFTGSLTPLLENALETSSAAERELLRLLAVCGRLDGATAVRLIDPPGLAALRRRGLIDIDEETGEISGASIILDIAHLPAIPDGWIRNRWETDLCDLLLSGRARPYAPGITRLLSAGCAVPDPAIIAAAREQLHPDGHVTLGLRLLDACRDDSAAAQALRSHAHQARRDHSAAFDAARAAVRLDPHAPEAWIARFLIGDVGDAPPAPDLSALGRQWSAHLRGHHAEALIARDALPLEVRPIVAYCSDVLAAESHAALGRTTEACALLASLPEPSVSWPPGLHHLLADVRAVVQLIHGEWTSLQRDLQQRRHAHPNVELYDLTLEPVIGALAGVDMTGTRFVRRRRLGATARRLMELEREGPGCSPIDGFPGLELVRLALVLERSLDEPDPDPDLLATTVAHARECDGPLATLLESACTALLADDLVRDLVEHAHDQGQNGLAEALRRRLRIHTAPPASSLTLREQQICALILQDIGVREAAAHLGISPRTVEKHLDNIYRKLGINNRAQLLDLSRHLTLDGVR